MKFVHIADMHFDCPFVNLSDKESLGDLRRLDQRKSLKKIIEYIKEERIEALLIAGDLYEHKFIKKSTIEYINNLFKEIPETKIYISPGNHDPYLKKSYYLTFEWNENVHIFGPEIKMIENENYDIYGYGFGDFYCANSKMEELEILNKNKTNLLIIHGTLNGASIEEKQYNSMSEKVLNSKGFDYIALGHIHKSNFQKNKKIIYPGSTISLGFDELGKHGMVIGEIKDNKLENNFISIDESEFKEVKIDVTQIISKEELIETINNLKISEKEFIKIVIEGKRNFEIDTYNVLKLIENDRIIKIKNKTQVAYDLEKIKKENTLKGIFVKEMLNKLDGEKSKEKKEIIENAIEIGIKALED